MAEFKISVILRVAWYWIMISDFWGSRDFFLSDEPLNIVISFKYLYRWIDVNQLISSTSAIQFHYQNADLTEIVAVAHISLPS